MKYGGNFPFKKDKFKKDIKRQKGPVRQQRAGPGFDLWTVRPQMNY
jgi:hypothetical protein